MDESLPRFAIEPETVIGEIVRSVDSSCATIDITALLEEVFCYRSQRRTLAEVLHTDAELLTSGRPDGPAHGGAADPRPAGQRGDGAGAAAVREVRASAAVDGLG
ncbi:hypothetical protein ACFYO6_38405 [Streptomyces anthocyanicus]|uniref:hypothetical protein n=1 Tax=Streptomyces anthocyanicus TaxID=68174 RepID=UPI00369C0822